MSQPSRIPSTSPPRSVGSQQGPSEPPQRPPAPATTRGPRPGKRGLIIAASVLAVLMLVAAGAVTHQVQVSAQRAEADRKADLVRQQSAAQAAARGFLTALSESDADKALSFAAARPQGNNKLLSREVLLEANTRAAITAVTVGEPALAESTPDTWTEGSVRAHFSVGDQPQTVDLLVRKVGTEWKIGQVTAPVDLGLTGPERVVNGVTVPPGQYNLFPGSYSVSSANPLVGVSNSDFILAAPAATGLDWSSDITLTQEGTDRSVEAVKHAVDRCLQTADLKPPDCPFIEWAESDGLSIERSTIRYTLKNDPWRDARFAFDAGTMTASTSVPVEHEIRARATRDGTPGTLVPQTQRRTAHILVKLQDSTPQVTFS